MKKKDFQGLMTSVRQAGEILRGDSEPSRQFRVKVTSNKKPSEQGFALCIRSDEPELLIPFKVYPAKFSSRGYVSITDEVGEKAVYPADYFMALSFDLQTEKTLKKLLKAA